MNKLEAAQVLAVLAAPHNREVSHDTAEVWYRTALERVGLDEGLAVAVSLVETQERFPTPAQFNGERARLARLERDTDNQWALPAVKADPAAAKRLLDSAREVVTKRRGAKHWHGGPDPCPVCGGMIPAGWGKEAGA